MANILMKSGEIREVSNEKMLSFLEENRDLIQTRHSAILQTFIIWDLSKR